MRDMVMNKEYEILEILSIEDLVKLVENMNSQMSSIEEDRTEVLNQIWGRGYQSYFIEGDRTGTYIVLLPKSGEKERIKL